MKRLGSVLAQSWARRQQIQHAASLQYLRRNMSQLENTPSVNESQGRNDRYSDQRSGSHTRTAFGLGIGLLVGATAKVLYDERTKDPNKRFLPSVHASSPLPPESEDLDDKKKFKKFSKRQLFNFVADAVEQAADGVVCIKIRDMKRHHIRHAHNIGGSGFVVSEDGLILTNAHVVTNAPPKHSIQVFFSNGKVYDAVVEEVDAVSDLALLRINCKELHALKFGNSEDVRAGEFVAALGSPLSLSNTVTMGVVSTPDRRSGDLGIRGNIMQYVQTDAAITFGNSGGPLINLDGEVIGINSMTITSGISFAIPINQAKEFITKAQKKKQELGKFTKPAVTQRRYLGITMLSLTKEIINELQARNGAVYNIPPDVNSGVFVWKVVVGSPAYQSGLQPGDIILSINDVPVTTARDIYTHLEKYEDLLMVIMRKGQRYKVVVSPED